MEMTQKTVQSFIDILAYINIKNESRGVGHRNPGKRHDINPFQEPEKRLADVNGAKRAKIEDHPHTKS